MAALGVTNEINCILLATCLLSVYTEYFVDEKFYKPGLYAIVGNFQGPLSSGSHAGRGYCQGVFWARAQRLEATSPYPLRFRVLSHGAALANKY